MKNMLSLRFFSILIISALSALFMTSCKKGYEDAMKSKDTIFIEKQADIYYQKGDYSTAAQLYQRLASMVRGTDKERKMLYQHASSEFKDLNYRTAAALFNRFYSNYPKDSLAEDALFSAAYSYYKGSPDYNLDQTNTTSAIEQLQAFINRYPDGKNIERANNYIKELESKLEKKGFHQARSYYELAQYKAACVSFENFLNDFPDTKYAEETYYFWVKSAYELAKNSIAEKKIERKEKALQLMEILKRKFPKHNDIKKIEDMEKQLQSIVAPSLLVETS